MVPPQVLVSRQDARLAPSKGGVCPLCVGISDRQRLDGKHTNAQTEDQR